MCWFISSSYLQERVTWFQHSYARQTCWERFPDQSRLPFILDWGFHRGAKQKSSSVKDPLCPESSQPLTLNPMPKSQFSPTGVTAPPSTPHACGALSQTFPSQSTNSFFPPVVPSPKAHHPASSPLGPPVALPLLMMCSNERQLQYSPGMTSGPYLAAL